MNTDGEIRRAKDSYVQDLIDVAELESRVWDALTGVWSPTSSMAAALKETWTDAHVAKGQFGSGAHAQSLRKRHDWHDGQGRVHSISLEQHETNLKTHGFSARPA